MACGYAPHSLFPLAVMQLPLRLRSSSSRHCPSTPASLSAPVAPKLELSLRSRCASAGHCGSTPASLSASCPFIPQRGSSRVAMCRRAVNAELPQNELQVCIFRAIAVVVQEAPGQTDDGRQAGRCILSTTSLTLFAVLLSMTTTSLTLFAVLLSMIVLPSAQVLHQASAGTACRGAARQIQRRAAMVASV